MWMKKSVQNRLSDRKKWIPPRLSALGNTLGGYGDIFESRKSRIRIIPLKFRNKNKFEESKKSGYANPAVITL